MPSTNSPHDAFTQRLLSRPEIAADFLRNYLPPDIANELDPAKVELVKPAFVDEELRRHASDLIYKVGIKRGGAAHIIVLVDHKSDPEKWVGLQLLRYAVNLWRETREKNAELLPVIVPVVLYHGRRRWRVSQQFSGLFPAAELKLAREFVPDFKYHLCDLNSFSDEELKGGVELRAGLSLLKHIFDAKLKAPLIRIFRWVKELPERQRNEYLDLVRVYLRAAKQQLSRAEFIEVLEEAFHEEAESVMEIIGQSWIEEGEQQGLQRGLQQGLYLTIVAQLQARFGPLDEQTQERIRKLPAEQQSRLSIALLSFKKRADFVAWLDESTTGQQ
jgi:predicted transposase/invertase (TIGR01784 family)